MKNAENTTKKSKSVKPLSGKCIGTPMISKQNETYQEAQFYVQTKTGRQYKVYGMQAAASKALEITEGQEVNLIGIYLTSDAYRMLNFK